MWKFHMFLMAVFFSIKDSAQGPDRHRLHRHLLADYTPLFRPVVNESEVITVRLGLTFLQIIDVDEKSQILTSKIWLQMYWKDYYLVWNALDYSGLDVVRLPNRLVWKPDIVLYNSADENLDFSSQSNVLVESSGSCTYIPPGIFKSTCRINMRWFPFDVQKCELKFGSWTHGSWSLDLQMLEADISNYIPSGEWDLIDVKGQVNQQKYQCCQEMYPDVTFTVVMRRRTLYYGLNLLLPCVLINTLALLVFVLPAESGEKITLGITVLLALTVLMLLVTEIIPPTSDSVPLLAQYIATVMVIVALSVIATVIALQYHHHDPRGDKMPKWSRVFLFNWCGWFLHMKHPGAEQERLSSLELSAPGSKSTKGTALYPSIDPAGRLTERAGEGDTGPSSSAGNMEEELAKLLDEVRSIGKHFRKQDADVSVRNEWKCAALVIDRLCLVVFSVITILCTVGILMSAPDFDDAV